MGPVIMFLCHEMHLYEEVRYLGFFLTPLFFPAIFFLKKLKLC